MSGRVPTLLDAFSLIEDFRHARGKRYKLPAILLLTWLAMLHGKRSELEIAEWGDGEGRRWLPLLGVRRRRGPSYATIHRIMRGIDRRQLEAVLSGWTGQARQAMEAMEAMEAKEAGGEGDSRVAEGVEGVAAAWLSEACQVLAQSLTAVAADKGADLSRLEGLAVTGAVAAEPLPSHPSEAGLKFWGLDWERIQEDRPVGMAA